MPDSLHRQILHGDVFEKLKEIPDESIDCIITSPPYWALRDYQEDGQMGLEPDFRDYLKKLKTMMDECKRILKKTGTCWINIGDTYSGSGRGPEGGIRKGRKLMKESAEVGYVQIQRKSRYGIPARFYVQCIDDGWIARNDLIWYKSNSSPTSAKDRFANKWESVFFFAKNAKYYFNLDPVREKPKTESKPFNRRVRDAKRGYGQAMLTGGMSEEEDKKYDSRGEKKQDNVPGADGKPKATYANFNERWNKSQQEKWMKHYDENGNCKGCGKHWTKHTVSDAAKEGIGGAVSRAENVTWCNENGKNPGDVFFINPKPFPESHFATFPPELPTRILKCACPQEVCRKCKLPRFPIIEEGKVVGWTKCDCNAGWEPGIVLDPFLGAGTTALAAEKLGLQWTGIELGEKYVTMSQKRLKKYRNHRMGEY